MTNCPIWGTVAAISSGGGDYLDIRSERAGGAYRVSGSALARMGNLSDNEKAKLTWWIAEQRRQGETNPSVTNAILDHVRSSPMPSLLERRDHVLDYMAERGVAGSIRLWGTVTDEMTKAKAAVAACSGSRNDQEVAHLIRFLREDRLITGDDKLQLTFAGWRYLEQRRVHQIASVQGFVAMWFDHSMDEVYARGFAPAIRDSGYAPMRIDDKQHFNKIDDEIVGEIRRSRFMVADFTSQPDRPRGGVYFEAGFAFGLNIPVIWTCRNDLVDHVHFDTRQFNHIVWTSPEDLYKGLKNRIGAVIGDGPLLSGS